MKKQLLSLSIIGLSMMSILNPSMAANSLSGTDWKLLSWGEEKSPQTLLKDTEITLQFQEDQISGSSGCNRYFASYTLEDDQLKFGVAGRTQMACPEDIMKQEDQFLSALERSQNFQINSEGQLQITYKTEQESGVMIFTPNQPE
ncbi:MAG: META domain-containing protein [Planktothrix sp.]|uniref:META domain-containing protein n=1 Tax=Planktothrix sp. TaxID=3088171 RepID=UPI0038D4FBFC